MTFRTLKVLIWGKTYPELSKRHTETVCTGAVLEDGTPIRLYPVPLRYLEGDKQFSLYDVVDVPAQRNRSDPRPESYRIVSDHLERLSHLHTDHGTWRTRSRWNCSRPAAAARRPPSPGVAPRGGRGRSIARREWRDGNRPRVARSR